MDTIAAIATGNIISAIGIVRMSGNQALTVADNVFIAANNIRLSEAKDRQMLYGKIVDTSGTLVDLCLCMVSRAPNSYTGEDTVEFYCHGSPVVLTEILSILSSYGVRQAKAGEFTKRAFLNGRMDLLQAESVIDLIQSETIQSAKNAAGQLNGAISQKMTSIYDSLLEIMAHFHVVIDYPDEDIDEFQLQNYITTIEDAKEKLNHLLDTFSRGKILKSGIPTAIVGRTNTGKSSLLNALLGYDRAIVTDIAGTTRDTIEEKILVGNVLLRLIDTAGLRETKDTVEKLGHERTKTTIQNSELVIVVLDGSQELSVEDKNILQSIPIDIPLIATVNKSDLPQKLDVIELNEHNISYCMISALTGDGLDTLNDKIIKFFPDFDNIPTGEIITNSRQAEAITKAITSLTLATEALNDKVTPDAVLTEIEAALIAVGEVTGKTIREDLVSKIFERFCVGK
ncbi:MAG: tRNA uridine-5-carboxymethylaminomethyl(34) synthesis GTPase MnmE [Oscillospiraceae bacterium]|nr:tRNA uridine-5-carboxymethylaminomethyl(34) synthesis GTPase MnmE [Oscillospiraceae bacterium]